MKEGSSRLYRLDEIAMHKLLLNISQIHDIGTTPPHLLVPIFTKMTSKQLDALEQKQPLIKKYLDSAWKLLITKDFPNYHFENSKLLTGNYKSLYFKYSDDMNKFKLDSITRLRKINENLQNSKSKIIVLPNLREPIRKSSRNPIPYRANSFVDKVKQDLLFKNKLVYSKPYNQDFQLNQFSPNNNRRYPKNGSRQLGKPTPNTLHPSSNHSSRPIKSMLKSAPNKPPQRFTDRFTMKSNQVTSKQVEPTTPAGALTRPSLSGTAIESTLGVAENVTLSKTSTVAATSANSSNKSIAEPVSPIKNKRKLPSIFLPNKRQLAKPITKRRPSKEPSLSSSDKPTILKPIKSSIFR